jgi:hypothetical protein
MQSAPSQPVTVAVETLGRIVTRALDVASWVFLTAGLCFCAVSTAFLLQHFRRMPFWDHWVWLARYHEAGLPGVLFTQFNEHRLFFPGFFYLVDYELCAGSNLFLTACILALQALSTAVLVWPLRTVAEMSRVWRV